MSTIDSPRLSVYSSRAAKDTEAQLEQRTDELEELHNDIRKTIEFKTIANSDPDDFKICIDRSGIYLKKLSNPDDIIVLYPSKDRSSDKLAQLHRDAIRCFDKKYPLESPKERETRETLFLARIQEQIQAGEERSAQREERLTEKYEKVLTEFKDSQSGLIKGLTDAMKDQAQSTRDQTAALKDEYNRLFTAFSTQLQTLPATITNAITPLVTQIQTQNVTFTRMLDEQTRARTALETALQRSETARKTDRDALLRELRDTRTTFTTEISKARNANIRQMDAITDRFKTSLSDLSDRTAATTQRMIDSQERIISDLMIDQASERHATTSLIANLQGDREHERETAKATLMSLASDLSHSFRETVTESRERDKEIQQDRTLELHTILTRMQDRQERTERAFLDALRELKESSSAEQEMPIRTEDQKDQKSSRSSVKEEGSSAIDILKEELDRLRVQVEKLQSEKDFDQQCYFEETDRLQKEHFQEVILLREEIVRLRTSLEFSERENRNLRDENERLSREISEKKIEVFSKDTEIRELRERTVTLEKEKVLKEDRGSSDKDAEIEDLKTQVSTLETEVDSLKRRIKDLEDAQEGSERRIRDSEAESRKNKTEFQRLQEAQSQKDADYRRSLEDIQKRLDAALEENKDLRNSFEKQLKEHSDEIDDLKRENEDLRNRIRKLQDELSSKDKTDQSQSHLIEELKIQIITLKKTIRIKESTIRSLREENINIRHEYEVISSKNTDLESENASLKQHIEELEEINRSTKAELDESEKERDRLKEELRSLGLRLKSLEDQIKRTTDDSASQEESFKIKISEFESRILILISSNAELKKELETATRTIESQSTELGESRVENERLNLLIIELREKIKTQDDEINTLKMAKQIAEEELIRLRQENEEMKAELRVLRIQLRDLNTKCEGQKDVIEDLEGQLEVWKAKCKELIKTAQRLALLEARHISIERSREINDILDLVPDKQFSISDYFNLRLLLQVKEVKILTKRTDITETITKQHEISSEDYALNQIDTTNPATWTLLVTLSNDKQIIITGNEAEDANRFERQKIRLTPQLHKDLKELRIIVAKKTPRGSETPQHNWCPETFNMTTGLTNLIKGEAINTRVSVLLRKTIEEHQPIVRIIKGLRDQLEAHAREYEKPLLPAEEKSRLVNTIQAEQRLVSILEGQLILKILNTHPQSIPGFLLIPALDRTPAALEGAASEARDEIEEKARLCENIRKQVTRITRITRITR